MKKYTNRLAIMLLFGLGSCSSQQVVSIDNEKSPKGTSRMAVSEKKPLKKEKLQIVFCFGQSNMVGLAQAKTAWYLTQPQYVPPREIATEKSRYFNWNFYWNGVRYYQGPQRQELTDLLEERRLSRMKWRQRANGVHGPWKEKEWGPKPGRGRTNMYPFLDRKAEEEGIYKRMAAILDSNKNEFNVNDAYKSMISREDKIAEELKRVREIYLDGATSDDYDSFDTAVAAAVKEGTLVTSVPRGQEFKDSAKHRATYASLAQKHAKLPIAKRTYIKVHGHVTGPKSDTPNAGNQKNAAGVLSIGYGSSVTAIGPEYGLGITLERLVDAPILLAKCSWGNTALASGWRPPSLGGVETATEKANREAENTKMAAEAKKAGREFTPRPAPTPNDKLSYCWSMTMPEIDKVLADPGKYHPEYNPEVGYEVAGLVWFQGYSDKGNSAYGEQLEVMIEDLRKKVKTPKMPVVLGTLGMEAYKQAAFANEVNAGMLQVSQMPKFADNVDVVNTAPFFPLELELIESVRLKTKTGTPAYDTLHATRYRSKSNAGFHYHGSAKCFLLMGDAMGRSLANLMAGGKPLISSEIKSLK